MNDQNDIRTLLHKLADIEALKQLKARYCHLVDAADWDALDALWMEDATCDYGFFGRFQGRSSIMDGFFRKQVSEASSFNAHMVHNPLIEVHGDRASGSWYLTAHTTQQPGNRAIWVMGIYHDEFQRVETEWKIASLRFEFKYFTPFDEGWARTPMWQPPHG
ncbi:nuclear transport factor 2 family protein [Seongchinamella sediminis]|uniref:Nuclear transport factor 2 family protein n=1 Tax=Seongchinamella sediminis TaxID=2283635 RepID=A0A3L7DWX4_9GAMM|nr:nuclear transport factor 2 family protein [Seongchinamella sediminis]RLQ21069.1 nuclear transport factor 2 family protein [Seongchinamella sediminis]